LIDKCVFLTGATGFVGGFIVEELLAKGYKVIVPTRKSSNLEYLTLDKITTVDISLDDVAGLHDIFLKYKVDYVINNAGLTRHKDEDLLNLVNAHYPKCIAEASNKANIKKIVHISSLAAYGPADFTQNRIITNSSTPHPVTAYGRSKLLGENKIKEEARIPLIIIRPTAVYGPRERDLLTVFKLINKRLEITIDGGDANLSFIFVKDLADLIVKTLASEIKNGEYFAAEDKFYTNLRLNELIKSNLKRKTLKINLPLSALKVVVGFNFLVSKLTNSYPVLNRDKYAEIIAKSWVCDVSKTKKDFDWQTNTDLKTGIKETVKWYLDNNWI
jgi:nucleoside-diphosphate-sugar epimerase